MLAVYAGVNCLAAKYWMRDNLGWTQAFCDRFQEDNWDDIQATHRVKKPKIKGWENEDENENDQETHPSKKKVRWDSGARDSGVDDQANSDDEPGGPQKVRCLKSIINYRFHLYCVP